MEKERKIKIVSLVAVIVAVIGLTIAFAAEVWIQQTGIYTLRIYQVQN